MRENMATQTQSTTRASGVGNSQVSMAAVPCLPLDPAWLHESPAFLSPVAAVVRAAFQMLDRAWRSIPAGTLPSHPGVLASLLGLGQDELAKHFATLTEGWELRDGRFVHPGMHALALRIWASQADALDHLAAVAPVVAQAPEDFQLLPQEAVAASPLKGKRRLPADFGLTPNLRNWLSTTLFVDDAADQDFLLNKFKDWAHNKNEKFSDPAAGFRLFASREDLRRLPSRQAPRQSGGLIERVSRTFGNSGDASTNRNRDVLRSVLQKRTDEPQPERPAA